MAIFRTIKKDGLLNFYNIDGYETRNESTFKCIQEADKIYNWGDFEIQIHTGDGDESSKHEYCFSNYFFGKLVPDFNFDAWPQVGINDYTETTQEIKKAGSLPPKILKVGWIGNTNTNPMRKKLLKYGQSNPQLFDIIDMAWSSSSGIKLNATTFLSMPELVEKYAFLIDVEGYGYSGRLKHLLWSRRPLLLVDRPHKEYFFEFLKEWEHYIPVKRDLSDLLLKMKWLLQNQEKAQIIANNALEFSKIHLTREACYSKWNDIIQPLQKLPDLQTEFPSECNP
jgi:hypothetical protein